LIRFGRVWLDLGDIWTNLIRLQQNQNLASPKKFEFLWLCCAKVSFIPRQYSCIWDYRHEHEYRK